MADKSHINGTTATPELDDPCVANAYIGAIFVGTTNRIFIRVDFTVPPEVEDWIELTNINGGFTFEITDEFAQDTIVESNDVVNFAGINGITVKLDGQELIFNGHVLNGTSNPSGTPVDPTVVSFYLNRNTNKVYVWNPTASIWVLVSGVETITTLVNNGNGTYTYTNEAGTEVTVALGQTITSLTDNEDGTITYKNELNNTVDIDIIAIVAEYLDIVNAVELDGSILKFKHISGEVLLSVNLAALSGNVSISEDPFNLLVEVDDGLYVAESITLLETIANGFRYTNEAGTVTNINVNTIVRPTIVDNVLLDETELIFRNHLNVPLFTVDLGALVTDVTCDPCDVVYITPLLSADTLITCVGEEIEFTDSSIMHGCDYVQTIWDFNDGSEPEVGTSVTHTFITAGLYFVTATIECTGSTVTQFIPIKITELNVSFIVESTFIELGTPVILTNTTNAIGCTPEYSWDFDDLYTTSETEPASYIYEAEGTYTITLTVTCGDCDGSFTQVIDVVA